VKQEQKGFEGVSMRYAGPELLTLGRAFGIRALAATDEATLHGVLIAAQTAPGPTLIDVRIDPSGYRRMLEIVRGAPK
jgi:thiamine pyrophosphate-dependent acetolactate synthase large subunit-like protein